MWEAVAAQRTAGRRGEVVAAAAEPAELAGKPGEEKEEEAAEEEGTTERRERVRDMAAWRSQSSGPPRPRAVIGLVRGGSMDSPEDDRQC